MDYKIPSNKVPDFDFKLKEELGKFLYELLLYKGSDLHIKANSYVRKRINGNLYKLENKRFMTYEEALLLAKELLISRFPELVEQKNVDFTYKPSNLNGKVNNSYRFRCNIFWQMEGVSMAFRTIPIHIPSFDTLGLPPVIKKICNNVYRGLVLVTGPTGTGKSTTLASMIDYINTIRKSHIITIEDPIEFVHKDKNCIINQRSIGQDALSFESALRAALREDPDIIFIGEMRDLDTIKTAIRAAETGHLVFSTLHTLDAKDTIKRIIGMFPGSEQNQIQMELASVLKAIISQRLCHTLDNKRIPALEIMLQTHRISNIILEGKYDEIYDAMVESAKDSGIQTYDQNLLQLYKDKIISKEEALKYATKRDDLEHKLDYADASAAQKSGDGDVVLEDLVFDIKSDDDVKKSDN